MNDERTAGGRWDVNSRINDLRLTIADLRISDLKMREFEDLKMNGFDDKALIGIDRMNCKMDIAKAFPTNAWNKDWLQRNCRACVIPLWV